MNTDYSFGYIMGVLKGDGCLCKCRDVQYLDEEGHHTTKDKAKKTFESYRHKITLGDVVDNDFAKAFHHQLFLLTGKKPTFSIIKRKPFLAVKGVKTYAMDTTQPAYRVTLCSKEWYHKLLPYRTNLDWLKTASIETKRGFLTGMFDSDGSVAKQKRQGWRVILYKKNNELLKICQGLLKEFGIESKFEDEKDMKGTRCSRIRFEQHHYIVTYAKEFPVNIARKNLQHILGTG